MNSRYEWVVFDFDGTLVDSLNVMFDVYCGFMRSHNNRATREEFEKLNGPTLNEIVFYLKSKYKIIDDYDKLLSQYEKMIKVAYMKDVKLFEGRKSLLDFLKNKGFKIGLVTSTKKKLVEPYLKDHEIKSYFDLIVYGDEVKQSKPNPEIYKIFSSKIKNTKVIVFEDSQKGIQSARKAGLKVCNVKNKKSIEIIKLID